MKTMDELPKWLQELWDENPNIARRAEKYITELNKPKSVFLVKETLGDLVKVCSSKEKARMEVDKLNKNNEFCYFYFDEIELY